MPEQPTLIDDQPISATFFGEGRWLTDFITPNALEVKLLHQEITRDIDELNDRLVALWSWVASEVKYTRFVRGKMWVDGKVSSQDDLWISPSVTSRVRVGNCATKSFLLTSLIRNELPANQVHCVLGNLHNGKPGGHAWLQLNLGGQECIMESTKPDAPPMVLAATADRYEAVHLFNDQEVQAIEGRTLMLPMTLCYSTWLKDYLDWAYIESKRNRA